MKVAFLVGSLAAGGLERFVTNISIRAVQQKAFVPVVICLNKKSGIFLEKLKAHNIQVEAADPGWYRSISGILSLRSLIRSLAPDVVHSQVNYSIAQQFVAARLAGKKFTITERSSYSRKGLSLLRRRMQYQLLKVFGVRYSANARSVAEHLGKMLHEPVERFAVIPNGIEDHAIDQDSINARKKTLGIAAHEVVIGYVARFDPPKGHALLLEVLNVLINQKKCPVKVILVGDGVLRPKIEKTIKAYGLENSIIFTGVVPDVEKWMPVFDIVSLLSNREGMPNAVIEAMAARRPVIATAVGNIPELLADGAGSLVNESDIPKIADDFEKLIYNEALRKSLAEKGYAKVKREFSIQATLDKLLAYYNTILA